MMSDATRTYLVHGMRIRSDIPFDAAPAPAGPVDVEVILGRQLRSVPPRRPGGEPMAELHQFGRLWYAASRDGADVILRFPHLAEFVLQVGRGRIVCHPHRDVPAEPLGLLLSGTVLATWLTLEGHLVLHASGVVSDGVTVAFAGLSGMGKSTCAALACVAGARLLSDDLVLVGSDLDTEPGMRGIRLRRAAAGIVDLFEGEVRTRATFDDRLAVFPPYASTSAPLRAVVIPRPDRGADRLVVDEVPPSQAVPLLLPCLRVPRWFDHAVSARNLRRLGELVARVPVFTASIPWGPPFDPEPVADLLAEVSAAGPPGS